MTVKRQGLLTLFLTLQRRSALIWKWEQPTHGIEGQRAKQKVRRSWWQMCWGWQVPVYAHGPQDLESTSSHPSINSHLLHRFRGYIDRRLEKMTQSRRENYLSLFKEKEWECSVISLIVYCFSLRGWCTEH